MEVKMYLVRRAQTLTTGAEVHDTNELVAMYQGAANSKGPEAEATFGHFERALEGHVAMLESRALRRILRR